MRKVMVWLMSIALVLAAAAGALAETAEPAADPVFSTLADLDWCFTSGAGGWSTDMRIMPDGTFLGVYHDSEMGETGDGYPNGSIYGCSFHGQMSVAEQVNENTWKIRIDQLAVDEGQVPEAIEDGIRYVTTDVYGLTEGDEMMLYKPGTPISVLSEDMQFWAHVQDMETVPTELPDWFLCSEAHSTGFTGTQAMVGLANPWEDLTEEELTAKSGLSFGVPEGAENVIYRYLQANNLAEMQFTIGTDEYCARMMPVQLANDELMDISGMYYEWEQESQISVGPYHGTIDQARAADGIWAAVCLWYNYDQGIMYSISVSTTNPDGLNLTAVAEQVGAPKQAN